MKSDFLKFVFVPKALFGYIMGGMGPSIYAQTHITGPNTSSAPNIDKCFGVTNSYTVLQFTVNGATPAAMTVIIPVGTEYVPVAIASVYQTGGLSATLSSGIPTAFTILK